MAKKSKKFSVILYGQTLESVLALCVSNRYSISKNLRMLISQGIYLRKLITTKNIKLKSELIMLLIFDNENLDLTRKYIVELEKE